MTEKTRGRKPMTHRPEPAVPQLDQELLSSDLQKLATVERGLNGERDLVNQIMGQVQMSNAMARFADVVTLTKLQQIKESKAYRALSGTKGHDPDGNEIADVGTFDGFCQALGLSRSKVDEDLRNLRIFGEDALRQLSAAGCGYRELRQFRQLPDDSKAALIEVAKTGDKESLLDLAEDLIARREKEKAELAGKVEAAEGAYAAREQRLEQMSRENNELREKLSLLPRMSRSEKVQKATKDYLIVLNDVRAHVRHAWKSTEKLGELALEEKLDLAGDEAIAEAARETGRLIAGLLAEMRNWGVASGTELVLDALGGGPEREG